MPKLSRIFTAVAALALLVMFVTPIWHIGLTAPQYPEGLGLQIHINTIVGDKPNDLNNINSLNHYIGMRAIDPSHFPELRWLPWIIGSLVALGLVAAASGKRRLLILWVACLTLVGVAGMVDMYRWGYEYGHDLDMEQAIIKVPGMAYQPPLIGTKQLLNFHAASWPAAGAMAAGAALALGILALVLSYRRRAPLATGAVLLAAACAAGGPQAIRYGEENCGYCRMTISDPRYGSQVVSATGKHTSFDSIECLASFVLESRGRGEGELRGVYVTDFRNPGTFLAADSAVFLLGGRASPMGLSLSAFATRSDADAVRQELGDGQLVAWTEVLALVEERRQAPGEVLGAR